MKCQGKTVTLADFVTLDLVRSPFLNTLGLSYKRYWETVRVEEFAETPRKPNSELR